MGSGGTGAGGAGGGQAAHSPGGTGYGGGGVGGQGNAGEMSGGAGGAGMAGFGGGGIAGVANSGWGGPGGSAGRAYGYGGGGGGGGLSAPAQRQPAYMQRATGVYYSAPIPRQTNALTLRPGAPIAPILSPDRNYRTRPGIDPRMQMSPETLMQNRNSFVMGPQAPSPGSGSTGGPNRGAKSDYGGGSTKGGYGGGAGTSPGGGYRGF